MRWNRWRCLGGLALALVIVASVVADGPWPSWLARRPALPTNYPEDYRRLARAALLTPLANQAANGVAIENTVWNHYFSEDDQKYPIRLHASGAIALDRLARRAASNPACGPLHLLVQRSQEVTFIPGQRKLEDVQDTRGFLDRKRIDAVQRYMAVNWPHVPIMVDLNDPPPASFATREATLIYQPHIQGVFGFLPLPIQGGLSLVPESLGQKTGSGADTPSVRGSGPGSAFGPESLPGSGGGGPGGAGLGGGTGSGSGGTGGIGDGGGPLGP